MEHYVKTYFAIGIIITIAFDLLLRHSKTDEPLNLPEYIWSIVGWPFVVYMFIKHSSTNRHD